MLDSLRSFSRTWVAKILIAVLVVSFAAFGIENVITGLSANVVARVGNEDITIKEFDRAYQEQMNFAAQQLGQVPTPQMAAQLGIPSMVIGRLAADAAVNTLAESLGVGVSDQRLGRMLRSDPTFGGTLGQFDPANFQRVLQQYGLSESEYIAMQRNAARREQVALSLLGDAATPKTANDILDRYSGDQRTVDYFLVNEQAVSVAEPTEEEVQAYFDEHKDQYRTVERRQVDLLTFTPDALAASIEIGADEIAAEYERTRTQLVRPESRTIQQVMLVDETAIKTAEDALAAGTSFADLITTLGVTPIELGSLTQAGISDPALGTTAFSLAADGYAITEGIGGKRIVHVSAITPGTTPTLEEATSDIRRRLALSAARNQYPDVLDQIEELHAAGTKVDAIAERFKLPYITANVTQSGFELTGIPDENRRQVATTIFNTDAGALAPTVAISSNLNVFLDVISVDEARDQTLDEVRERVVAAWTKEKTDAAILALVEKSVAELGEGKDIAEVANDNINQFSVLSQPMTRQGDGTTLFPAQVASAVFAGGPDHYGSALNGDGDHVVFKVAEVTPAAEGSASQQARDYLVTATRDTIFGEFSQALRDDAGLRVNQQTLNQLVNPTIPGN